MSTVSNDIGYNIKKFRKQAGLTQKALAEKCGVATGTIQQYELGKREPRTEQQEHICEVLGIPTIALLSGRTDIIYNAGFLSGIDEFLEIVESVDGDIEKTKKIINLKQNLINSYQRLNIIGQQKAVEQVELLTKIPEYRKEDTPE